MASDRVEWVEIIEPRTKEHMYANLATGECVWDPPPGVKVKKTDDSQWWELFDQNTSRFYYYNATSQMTVWHRPKNCDIIPLAKLQTLKQNTEAVDEEAKVSIQKESVGTQTSTRGTVREEMCSHHKQKVATACASTQTSPVTSPNDRKKHHHHHHKKHGSSPSSPQCSSSQPLSHNESNISNGDVWTRQSRAGPQNSGRLSDASQVSGSGKFRRQGSYCSNESVSSMHFPKKSPNSEVTVNIEECPNHKAYKSTQSNPAYLLKPFSSGDHSYLRQRSFDLDRTPSFNSWRHHSVDSGSGPPPNRSSSAKVPSREKSSSFLERQSSELTPRPHRRHHSEGVSTGNRNNSSSYLNQSTDGTPRHPNEGLCTPVTHRRHWSHGSSSHSAESSMSSPQSPHLQGYGGSADSSPLSADFSNRMPESSISKDSTRVITKEVTNASLTPHKMTHSREGSEVSVGSFTNPNDTNSVQQGIEREGSPKLNQQPTPLYSNMDYPGLWDAANQSYLLPLHHYILEQAKLLGYKLDFMGDDRDSLSQSDDSEGHRDDDDDDDFADDEAMSHQDSSSQEYLDESRFLDDEEDDDTYCENISQGRSRAERKLSEGDAGESDTGSWFSSSPIMSSRSMQQSLSTQHASLRRRRMDVVPSHTPALEKSQSFQADMGQSGNYRPLSMLASSVVDAPVPGSTASFQRQGRGTASGSLYKDKKPPSESDIEKYAQDNLNRHKKGIFRKKFTIRDMLSWSKDPIRKPMIMTTDKSLKRDACELFKFIQAYMGDRKLKGNQTQDAVALEIATRGWSKQAVRDELYIQICRQTTDNPRRESLVLGWELMAICLTFFPPSVTFQPYLESYISRHKDSSLNMPEVQVSHYATVCSKRLERIAQSGAKKGLRKPTVEEIDQSRIQIFRPSMFGNTLEEVLALQKTRYPIRNLPWIQTTLSEAVLQLNGAQTEGIFRVPGDIDEVNALKLRMDQWEDVDNTDPHVPASLLKLWYRELHEPLIPNSFYEDCITYCNDPETVVGIVRKLPEINRLVLSYLVRFLQVFAAEENSTVTKMDTNNLAMVMAPNCLRCMSDDPRIIFENTRKEMAFMRTLIQSLDTSYMEGVL